MLLLAHIFIIEEGAEFNITKMLGTEAFFSLSRFFSLPSDLLQGVAREQHLQQCIQLANQTDIWKLENPKDFRFLKQLIAWVEEKSGE